MNYHIMASDKFIDNFINDVYEIGEKENNVFWIRGTISDNRYISNIDKVEWVGYDQKNIEQKLLSSVTENDKVVIHWYDMAIGETILKLPQNIQVYAVHWGGDFYQDPYLYHINWVHDPITLQFVKRKICISEKMGPKPDMLLRQLSNILIYKKKSKKEFVIKKQTVERINCILIDPNNSGEVELTKKIYNIDNLPFLPFNYNQNFDLANSFRNGLQKENKTLNILIGNSGTESNNHVDCFKALNKYRKQDIKLSVPLSYGSHDYIQFVRQKGIKIFNGKFEALENFLPRTDYIARLNQIDIGIMYHNRSQAFGNIITLLSLGKKVYLKKSNPLWEVFKKTGIKVFDAHSISDISFNEFSILLTSSEVQSNVERLSNLFSDKKRLEYLAQVLNG